MNLWLYDSVFRREIQKSFWDNKKNPEVKAMDLQATTWSLSG